MPIIIDCVYKTQNMPPWELPANKNQSGMLRYSAKSCTASHVNVLRFHGRKDVKKLLLYAEKDWHIEVEHDESH